MGTVTTNMTAGAQNAGTGRGYDTGSYVGDPNPMGSFDSTAVNGQTITSCLSSGPNGVASVSFAVAFQDLNVSQTAWTSVAFVDKDSVPRLLNSADAEYSGEAAGGNTQWAFNFLFDTALFADAEVYALLWTFPDPPVVTLEPPEVVGATDVLLTWAPTDLGELTVESYDVLRDGIFLANTDSDVVSYADQVDTPSTAFTYQIRMNLSDASSVLSNEETVTTGDATAEFNCDCELVSSFRTLAQLRFSMAVQCGYAATAANLPSGSVVEFNEYLRTAQVQLYLKFRAQRTERFFRWTMTPGLRYYGLSAAEGECALQLNPLAVTWVGFEDLNKAWYRLVEGIDPVYYTRANINFGWPTRYEIRSCIEIFPAPQAAYTLWIKGDIGLAPFAVDADRTTFDDEAVLLFAVANWKSAKGKPDWERAMNQATARIQDLTARKHGTYRYVPSTYVQNPATPPRFLPLGSQQA